MGKKQIARVLSKAGCSKGATILEYQTVVALGLFICLNSIHYVQQQSGQTFVDAGTAMVGFSEASEKITSQQSPGDPDGQRDLEWGGGTSESVEEIANVGMGGTFK
ncbi:MAG: hypothetical protein KDD66_14020 [Bdellovibrionales bacterium]|nr:hypothetical protein [Bdellovibrionales bacterium]